jgi:hypothetical protein
VLVCQRWRSARLAAIVRAPQEIRFAVACLRCGSSIGKFNGTAYSPPQRHESVGNYQFISEKGLRADLRLRLTRRGKKHTGSIKPQ